VKSIKRANNTILRANNCGFNEEQHAYYTPYGCATRCQYDYRDHDGELFSTVKDTLKACQDARDRWLKNKHGNIKIEDYLNWEPEVKRD